MGTRMRTQNTRTTEAAEGSALRRRSRTSFDFRLFAIFFLSWIAVGVTPKTWRIENVLGGMLLVLVFFVGLSIHHRRQLGWRWPGVRVTNGVLQIIFLLWLGALFAWMFVSLSGQVVREMTPFWGCLGTILLYAVLSTQLHDRQRSSSLDLYRGRMAVQGDHRCRFGRNSAGSVCRGSSRCDVG